MSVVRCTNAYEIADDETVEPSGRLMVQRSIMIINIDQDVTPAG